MSHHNYSYLGPSDIHKPLECNPEVSGALKSTLHPGGNYDSIGRWVNEELVKDCDESLISSECNYWNTIAIQSDEKELSCLSPHMQLDIDSLAPSLSQQQLFSIVDFSPDWAYSGDGTKVLISGIFLGGLQPDSVNWCCMFGDVEVSAEMLTTNTIRCHAPPHWPGRVPFYITCSNRFVCSEVREFEYREHPPNTEFSSPWNNELEDELHLQIHFAKFLSLRSDNLGCSVENCCKCSLKSNLFHMLNDETEWDEIENFKAYNKHHWNIRDELLVKLLKGRLYEWLVHKSHEEGKGPNVLDERGRGIIHLAAALGYEWAMRPIVAVGISPSFRDAQGRTALHWAAYYGREETVAILLKIGVSPGAIEDPTTKFPQGQTAADLASSRGHKGIAGYLAEADLTSHLLTMSLTDKTMDSVSAALITENPIGILEGQELASVDEGQISFRESLAAVRNSTQAAARIQAVFRAQSFRQRELKYAEKPEIDQALMLSSLSYNFHRMSNYNSTSHIAAIRIQQKYRGWKGRREFMKIRNRIVKIQAHVRGHQVRKHYKKVVWSVSVVEKVILRWRRKGTGLRGFRAATSTVGPEQMEEKTDEYEYFRLGRMQKVAGIEKALARVRSMVRHPEACDQYMRLLTCSGKSSLPPEVEASSLDRSSLEKNKVESDPPSSDHE